MSANPADALPFADRLERARRALATDDLAGAIAHYEAAIELDPDARIAYWELGIASILADREEEAQTLWFSVMMAAGEAEADWLAELLVALNTEADRQRERRADRAWVLRRHAYEIAPDATDNTLALVDAAIEAARLSPDDLDEWNIAAIAANHDALALDRWGATFLRLLDRCRGDAALPAIARATFARPDLTDAFRQTLYPQLAVAALSLGITDRQATGALVLADVALEIVPDDFEVLNHTVNFYRQSRQYDLAVERAKRAEAAAKNDVDRAFAIALRLQCLLATGGRWPEAQAAADELRQRLSEAIDRDPRDLTSSQALHVLTSTFCLGYLRDRPDLDRPLVNRAAALAQVNLAALKGDRVARYRQQHQQQATPKSSGDKLRIGFLSDSLRSHSVGWLARWPFEYYDRDRFEFYAYVLNARSGDPVQQWYVDRAHRAHLCGIDSGEIADRIAADAVDILIDLDSLTVDVACAVMALKPAPVQCTWLGFDASGLPTIDYYIADALTLPDDAQDYYAETIWRLPHSYIAIDGFEQGVPTLHRRDLGPGGIAPDAIVYFTNQTGQKRNPDIIRLQLEVLRGVPGSHLLVKGLADAEAVRAAFLAIADDLNVERDRLHFLGRTRTEQEHRANLAIADIVLDTYPYNGATTTLETLWAGSPLGTRAGRQFSGRNSFAMLKQVGVEAGIAWSDREYVDWGVRLGRDASLRQSVAWQLRESRRRSPLWDGRGLTRDLEAAFEEMWARFLAGQC